MNRFARYAIPVAQDAILVARDGLKTVSIVAKILERFNQSMLKLVSSGPSALHRIYLKRLFLKRWGYINHNISFMATLRFSNVSGLVSEKSIFLPFLAKPEKHKGMRFEIYPDWFESRSFQTALSNLSVFKFIRNIVDGTLEIQNIC